MSTDKTTDWTKDEQARLGRAVLLATSVARMDNVKATLDGLVKQSTKLDPYRDGPGVVQQGTAVLIPERLRRELQDEQLKNYDTLQQREEAMRANAYEYWITPFTPVVPQQATPKARPVQPAVAIGTTRRYFTED